MPNCNHLIFLLGLFFSLSCAKNHKTQSEQTNNLAQIKKDTLTANYFEWQYDTLEIIKRQTLPQISIQQLNNSAEISVFFKNISNDSIWIPASIELHKPEFTAARNCYLEFKNTRSQYISSDIDCALRVGRGPKWQRLAPSALQTYNLSWLWLYPNAKNCEITFRLAYNPVIDKTAVSNWLTMYIN